MSTGETGNLTWPQWLEGLNTRQRIRAIVAAVDACAVSHGRRVPPDGQHSQHCTVSMAEEFLLMLAREPGPVVTEGIGYVPGSKPEGLTVSPEAAEALERDGQVLVYRDDLRDLLDSFWACAPDDFQPGEVMGRLTAAAGESR